MKQGDLFEYVGRPSAAQADAARDEGVALVAANAEEASPGFAERARAFVLCYLTLHDEADGETITDAALAAGIVPHDLRAFGAVYMALARAGLIEKTGEVRKRRRGHNTSGNLVWRLGKGK